MATVNNTFDNNTIGVYRVTWSAMTTSDVGSPVEMDKFNDKSVQLTGDFGSGATVAIQGSNEETPTNWVTLRDAFENSLAALAVGTRPYQIVENMRWIRPVVTGGTSPSINVLISAKGK